MFGLVPYRSDSACFPRPFPIHARRPSPCEAAALLTEAFRSRLDNDATHSIETGHSSRAPNDLREFQSTRGTKNDPGCRYGGRDHDHHVYPGGAFPRRYLPRSRIGITKIQGQRERPLSAESLFRPVVVGIIYSSILGTAPTPTSSPVEPVLQIRRFQGKIAKPPRAGFPANDCFQTALRGRNTRDKDDDPFGPMAVQGGGGEIIPTGSENRPSIGVRTIHSCGLWQKWWCR